MSHEQSITIQGRDGRWVNIPTVHKGKKIKDSMAADLYEQGIIHPLDGKYYKTEPAASYRAAKRSMQTPEDHAKRGIRPPGARR